MISKLILIYPIIQGIVSLIFNGEMLNKLFVFYMSFVFLMYSCVQIKKKGYRIRKANLAIMLLAAVYIPMAYIQEFRAKDGLGINGFIFYVYFCFYVFIALFLVGDNEFSEAYHSICCDRRFVLKISTVYVVLILTALILKIGIDSDKWGTTTFRAWFGLAHGFSYELMVFLLLNLLIWIEYKRLYTWGFIVFFLVIILFTGVRTSLVAVLVIGFFYFWNMRVQGKFSAIMLAAIGIGIAWKMGVFNTLIEKTLYSIANGDIGGSRFRIWQSSIGSFYDSSLFHKIFGSGYGYLLAYNDVNGMQRVHAHNDLMIAMVCYGFTSLFVYLYCLFRYIRSRFSTVGGIIFIVFVAFVNGYFIYGPVLGLHCITILVAFYGISKKHSKMRVVCR